LEDSFSICRFSATDCIFYSICWQEERKLILTQEIDNMNVKVGKAGFTGLLKELLPLVQQQMVNSICLLFISMDAKVCANASMQ
jgi:hypothetical protein